jgi:putative FmdB family regulatory protein
MPTYEYRCDNGHLFEVIQRMADDSLTSCSTCGAPVQRVFHPVAVHFKGSGFYNTDYGKKKGGGEKSEPAKSESSSEESKNSDSKSSDSKSSDSKSSDSKTSDSKSPNTSSASKASSD